MAMLATSAGIDLLHVPFQGGGPAMTALLGGQVQAAAAGPGPLTPHVRSGALRVLASWGARRIAGFEQVPTLTERGYQECEFYIWAALFAPAGTPPAILARLRESAAAAVADPEVARALAASGNALDFREGEAFAAFFRADTARLVRAVRRIGKVE
jgi:tripartite-type tricarboxylate transporter receptor subunit TctC